MGYDRLQLRRHMLRKNRKRKHENLVSEDAFRLRVIEDLEARGLNVVNMRRGTFDCLLDMPEPRMVEFKLMLDFRQRRGRGKIGDDFGIEFTESQSRELKKLQHSYPMVVIKAKQRYYLLTPSHIRDDMTHESRQKARRVIVSKKYFPPPLEYERLIDEIAGPHSSRKLGRQEFLEGCGGCLGYPLNTCPTPG
jgi:hypothetical protein